MEARDRNLALGPKVARDRSRAVGPMEARDRNRAAYRLEARGRIPAESLVETESSLIQSLAILEAILLCQARSVVHLWEHHLQILMTTMMADSTSLWTQKS